MSEFEHGDHARDQRPAEESWPRQSNLSPEEITAVVQEVAIDQAGRLRRDAGGMSVPLGGNGYDITDRKRVEEALCESEERFRVLVQASSQATWETNAEGVVVTDSPTWRAYTGQSAEEWMGNGWASAIHPDDREFAEGQWRQALAAGTNLDAEFRLKSPDGGWRWTNVRAAPLRNPDGSVRKWVGMNLDITERKEAEQQLFEANQRLWALMEAVPVGVSFSDDPSCQHITGNSAALSQFEVLPQDNLSASAPEATAPGRQVQLFSNGRSMANAELPLQRAVAENRVIDPMELEIQLPSGRRWFAEASGAPVRDAQGKVIGGLAVTVDITRRKRAEEQLKTLNETLEQRVKERAAESQWRANQLQQLAAQMAQTEERERRRLSQVLHDGLQQVLVAAKLRLGAAIRTVPGERSLAAVKEAFDLVDEAIAESRCLTKELSPPVLYDGGLAAGLEWLARETEKKYQLPVAVLVAPEMEPDDLTTKIFIFQAARELILNAVKHAHASSLRVGLSRADDHRLEVSVEDDGTGFDAEVLDRKEERGGFGLFSIRERLNVIGGQLSIASTPLEGTKATILAPCRRSPRPKRRTRTVKKQSVVPENAYASPTKRIRVLLADDHPVLRKGLADTLREHPALNVVGEARDGHEAVEMALQMRPDVVLMDITMPWMDGIEATRQIKETMPEMRVIGLSMHESEEMMAAMKSAGASEYLTKTVPTEAMIAAIFRACPQR